jgi:CRISPR-associated protein Csb1
MSAILELDRLEEAVAGTAAAFRCVTRYEPAGGTGDKVFPATYEGGRYATEERRLPDEEALVPCVLLDSVQSQANRMEMALLEAWRRERIPLPVVTVDFAESGLERSLRISSLEAPHRLADALLRDSLLDGEPFRRSAVGRRLDTVDARDATALFELCPTALVFGLWDSTGPRGGLGAKFQRALVSEIVGIDSQVGTRTSSRVDPAQIRRNAGTLYLTAEGQPGVGWTLDEAAAARDSKGRAIKLGKEGRPSEANHGNVTPTLAEGGVTIRYAQQTTVLSLPALRRLRFPLDGAHDDRADRAAHTALAALGLCAAALAREEGADLRSRCQLHATTPFVWELLDRPGEEPERLDLPAERAIAIYGEAVARARAAGLPWLEHELVLQPSEPLAALVRKSQELAAEMAAEEGAA